jgi:hypothetical protein
MPLVPSEVPALFGTYANAIHTEAVIKFGSYATHRVSTGSRRLSDALEVRQHVHAYTA